MAGKVSPIYEEQKQRITKELLSFNSHINLRQYGASILFDAIRKDPRALFYIKNSRVETRPYGCFEAVIEYENQDIDLATIEYVTSEYKAEGVIDYSIRRYYDRIVLFTKEEIMNQTALLSTCNRFIEDYSPLFPSLTTILNESATSKGPFGNYVFVTLEFKYVISGYKLKQMEKTLNAAMDDVCRKIFRPSMSPLVKAYVAHNYLASTVTYWREEALSKEEEVLRQSAFGALIDKKCVCQGYAEAYKRLLEMQGIECQIIGGKVKGSPTYHAWNLVGIDKQYFHVDVTWDASENRLNNKYFGVSDEEFSAEREWTSFSEKHPAYKKDWKKKAKEEIDKYIWKYINDGVDKRLLII